MAWSRYTPAGFRAIDPAYAEHFTNPDLASGAGLAQYCPGTISLDTYQFTLVDTHNAAWAVLQGA
ncbi:hypothetical protein DA83_23030 [Pseudomonas sp. 250J]|nr:hypothetical protein DA83_23030 [Pseudomonas sp. 250J]